MITINKTKVKEQWFDYDEDTSFLIRPFPLSERVLSPSGSIIHSLVIKQVTYCLLDWKGFKDENGNDVKCTDENKKFILDYSEELILFISAKAKEMVNQLVNLPPKKN